MSAGLHAQAVDVLIERGQNDEALVLCDKAVKVAPSAAAWLQRAKVQVTLGFRKEVRASVEEAARLEPGSIETRLNCAEHLESVADYEGAFAQLARVLELDPRSLEGLLRSARLRLWKGDDEEALALAARGAELAPRSAEARRSRGAAQLRLGRRREAARDLDEALRLDPRDVEAYIWRGELARLEGRLDDAVADFKRAREIWPFPMGALVNLELICVLRGEPIPPVEHDLLFTRVPKEIFRWSGTRVSGGPGGGMRHVYDKASAVRELEGVLEAMRGNRSLKSTFALGEGGERRIIEHLHFFPRDGLMNLQATMRFGNYRRVLALFDEIIDAQPDEAYPYSHRGEARLWAGRYRDALADFGRARSLNDYLLWPKVGLGASHLLLDELEPAERYIDVAAQNATDSIICTWRGELRRKQGLHERALAELDKIREPLPFRPGVWLNKALSFAALGRAEETGSIMARLKRHAPGFVGDAEREAKSQDPAAVAAKALSLMRGCRSSWMYCYVLDERVRIIRLRDVRPEDVPPILRGFSWAFEGGVAPVASANRA